MKILKYLICLKRGHLPITDGHMTTEALGIVGYGLAPDFQKIECARGCGCELHLYNNSFLKEKVDRWVLSERCLRDLKFHTLWKEATSGVFVI